MFEKKEQKKVHKKNAFLLEEDDFGAMTIDHGPKPKSRNKILIGVAILLFILAAAAVITSACFTFGSSSVMLLPLCHCFATCCGVLGISASSASMPTLITGAIIAGASLLSFIAEIAKPDAIRRGLRAVFDFVKSCVSREKTAKKDSKHKSIAQHKELHKDESKEFRLNKRNSGLAPILEKEHESQETKKDNVDQTVPVVMPTPTQAQLISANTNVYQVSTSKPLTDQEKYKDIDEERKKLDDTIYYKIKEIYGPSCKLYMSWRKYYNVVGKESLPEDTLILFTLFESDIKANADLNKMVERYKVFANDKNYNSYLKNENINSQKECSTRRLTMNNQYQKHDVREKSFSHLGT